MAPFPTRPFVFHPQVMSVAVWRNQTIGVVKSSDRLVCGKRIKFRGEKIENHECDAERQVEASPDEEIFFLLQSMNTDTLSLCAFIIYNAELNPNATVQY